MIPLLVSDIGRTKYNDAWSLQQRIFSLRQHQDISDVLLLTEHEDVYTFGKGSDIHHLLASEKELKALGTDVFHIDRGGDVTYHGPGQIVGYPIIDLEQYFKDIHKYLRSLEEVIIQVLSRFDILAGREQGMTGVWVQGEKIAAIGVKVSRWITMHGFALNVNTDLSKYNKIIPCGIFHKGVTSMRQILDREVPLASVQTMLVESFSGIFGCQYEWMSEAVLHQTIMQREIRRNEQNSRWDSKLEQEGKMNSTKHDGEYYIS